MGKVRSWRFDAAIGVGGQSAEPRRHGIDGKVNWIGITAQKSDGADSPYEAPVVTFDHFCLMENSGPELAVVAPKLARHLYDVNRRVVVLDNDAGPLYEEALTILKMAANEPPSKATRKFTSSVTKSCGRRCA